VKTRVWTNVTIGLTRLSYAIKTLKEMLTAFVLFNQYLWRNLKVKVWQLESSIDSSQTRDLFSKESSVCGSIADRISSGH